MLHQKVVYYLLSGIGEAIGAGSVVEAFLNGSSGVLAELEQALADDHDALLKRDPAYGGEGELPLVPNAPFQAVVAYRLAHRLWTAGDREKRRLAVAVQHLARVATAIDIHPGARIGARFIVDHGSGTVIGETAVIGDDCYILNGVTLGARGIAANPAGRRHPTLGNRVEVASFCRILGPVNVGDDVFVAPFSCITEHIPDGARVASSIGRPTIKLRPANIAAAVPKPAPLDGAAFVRAQDYAPAYARGTL